MGNGLKRNTGKARTYFLLLLLFSGVFSFGRWSSDGGVAESFSFLGRATGMTGGGAGYAAGGFGFTYIQTLIGARGADECAAISRASRFTQSICAAKFRTQFPGPQSRSTDPLHAHPT